MKNSIRKILSVLVLSIVVLAAVSAQSVVERTQMPYAGKTVILHSNDVHGAIEGYAYMPTLKAQFEAQGANVILVDAGDYSQGTTYVSTTKGMDAIDMMNAVGYHVATLGNHEFDYGYPQLAENLSKANFIVVCSDVLDANGNALWLPGVMGNFAYGLKVAVVGVETPESWTKVNPALIKGLQFPAGKDMYNLVQSVVDSAKDEGADIVIALAHLGVDSESEPNTSYDLYANTNGIDFIIDGHSHTVMTEGPNGEPIQSTGTKFANIGVIVIDNLSKTIEDHYLVSTENLAKDPAVLAAAQKIIDRVNEEYGEVFAKSEVVLNGDRDPGNRTEETNNGDLITDAMLWFITKDEGSVTVPVENVLSLTNGGGIRAAIEVGDVTKKDINTVLPFGNTVAVVYVTGAELLEALEASTYCTPTSVGGFPQVSGIEFTINTAETYDANESTYPASTYHGPASIKRVTINSINGKDFDPAATYAVVTNNFCAAGGDTYYAFAAASSQFDTGMPLDEVVMQYVQEQLGGVIGQEYAETKGRITVL